MLISLKSLQISTFDIRGGAARAAYRLHKGLRMIGIDSKMLVQEKFSDDWTVLAPKTRIQMGIAKTRATIDSLPLRYYTQFDNYGRFFPQWLPDSLPNQVKQIKPDIINLHWISGGFVQIETLSIFKQPLVWTLHDMWAFTGGCHSSQECEGYISTCGNCPQLHSDRDQDLSRWVWKRKSKAWKSLDLTIVTPSEWLANVARKSSLLSDRPIHVIPHGLDTKFYRPLESKLARDLLNLPQDKYLVLFGAMRANSDLNKGWQFLQPTLHRLKQFGWEDKLEVVIFGISTPEIPIDMGFPCHYLGQLHDDLTLAVMYAASDVTLVPSKQESFGQTASESLACGTPVVAFGVTGLLDIVNHQQDGYLATPFDYVDLANGIDWVLADSDRHQTLRVAARKKAKQEFDQLLQAKRYQELFHKVLNLPN